MYTGAERRKNQLLVEISGRVIFALVRSIASKFGDSFLLSRSAFVGTTKGVKRVEISLAYRTESEAETRSFLGRKRQVDRYGTRE